MMRIKALLLIFTILFSCLSVGVSAEASTTPEVIESIFTEEFNADAVTEASGVYTYTGNETIIYTVSNGYENGTFEADGNGGYAMKVCTANNNIRMQIKPSASVSSGVVIYEMDMMYTGDTPKSSNVWVLNKDGINKDDKGTAAQVFLLLGKPAIRNPNYSGDKILDKDVYFKIRLILDLDNAKYYVQYGDGILHDDMPADKYSMSNFGGIQIHIPKGNSGSIYIDNIHMYTADSMASHIAYPADNSEEVSRDTDIKVNFTQQMAVETLIADNFILMNNTTGESMAVKIKNAADCSVEITPAEKLLPESNYTLLSTDSLTNKAGESYAGALTSFTTEAVVIEDSCNMYNPMFENNTASVIVQNNSDSDITADMISVLYEISSDGDEVFADSTAEQITIPSGDSYDYSHCEFTADSDKKYVVRYFLWDAIDSMTALSRSAVAGGDASEAETVYISPVAPFEITDVNNDMACVEFECGFETDTPKRITYVIKNPEGEIAYIGQNTLSNSNTALGARFANGSLSGEYTVDYLIAGTSADNDTFELDLTQAKPTAIKTTIEGNAATGEILKGTYEYFHIGNVPQSGTTVQWYVSDTEDGTYTPISGASQDTLELGNKFDIKYIKFGVTARNATVTGNEVFSEPVKIKARPSVSDVSISGTVKKGETVSASYTYYHPENAEMDRVEIRWLKKSGGSSVEIGTGASYRITESAGTSIAVEVTPYSKVYPEKGTGVISSWVSIKDDTKTTSSPSRGGAAGRGPVSVSVPQAEEPQTPDYSASIYADVSDEHWAYESINELSRINIITGTGEGRFEPDRSVNRAEFITMIVRALDIEPTDENVMNDIKSDDWYCESVNAAAKAGLVSGFEGKFRPMDPITREEMAVILANAFKYKGVSADKADVKEFTDASDISFWAADDVNAMAASGMLSGFEDGSFRGKELTTRAQSAAVISRLIKK